MSKQECCKNPTPFGLMVQKLCTCEVQIILTKIDPYLLNHTWEIHVLGLFGKCLSWPRDSNSTIAIHKSCISLKNLQNGNKFDLIWIWDEWVMHFWRWGKSLVQWYWSIMAYNVSSYHMLIKVDLALPPNIKV